MVIISVYFEYRTDKTKEDILQEELNRKPSKRLRKRLRDSERPEI